MQNRYVGDVGDFAKYSLLRHLTSNKQFKLGVVWCLFVDESHNGDGRHIGYLHQPEFRRLEPALHDTLARLIHRGRRSVQDVAQAKIFKPGTIFFDDPAGLPIGSRSTRANRAGHRNDWIDRAFARTAPCNLVFFDPDNGIEASSVARDAPKAGKYIYWSELLPFWERGQSLVIYHHLNRTASVQKQTDILREAFIRFFPEAGFLKPLLFRRGSCRHFWIIGQRSHAPILENDVRAMLQSDWSGYFEVG